MWNHWRQLGLGAVLGSAIGTSGCMHVGRQCGSACEPACQPGCQQDCQPCGHRHGGRLGNCGWCLTGWMHRRSNAIPDTLPLGKVNEAWYYEMQTNAEAYDFVMHDLDFVGQTTELTSDGKDHVLEIAARMRSAPFPVIIERSPDNADPELDLARRNLIVQILCDFGHTDAHQRVVIAPAYGQGMWSQQAQRMYFQHVNTGGWGGGNFGGGGGFGMFGGGGVGFGN
ncbi:MAG: hypothetical protein KF774_12350 [Planctomyces sp.]|nr:hypothetical protein [Planctomyces sp.]